MSKRMLLRWVGVAALVAGVAGWGLMGCTSETQVAATAAPEHVVAATDTPTAIPTDTPLSIPTVTPTHTATASPEPTQTDTATPTATPSPVPTPAPTQTPTSTAAPTPVPRATRTAIPTATIAPIHTATATVTSTATPTPVPTATRTATPSATATPTGSVATDRAALVALYRAMNGREWVNSTNWLTDGPLNEWFGVTTDRSTGRVTVLELGQNNLKGELPSELGDLATLNGLLLHTNFITDVSALSNLTGLEVLDLLDNGVSDISPLLSLPNLRVLVVWANPLTKRSFDEHISALQARGVEVYHPETAIIGEDFTVEDGPQVFNDNIFILPVETATQGEIVRLQDYTASFYKYFEDKFDFLMFITVDRLFLDTGSAGFYVGAKNDVRGIGKDIFSRTRDYGSAGQLRGVVFFSAPHEFRSVFLHEVMHSWGASVLPGEVSDGIHWLNPSDLGGQLEGNCDVPFDEIVELGEDRYLLPECSWPRVYSPLELYLAGFIPPEEVPDFWVASDGQWIEFRREFTAGEIRRYTVEDVIAAHGRRVPDASQAQREFRAAAILLIDENRPVSMDMVESLSGDVAWMSDADHEIGGEDGSKNFYQATGGRARIVMDGLSEFLKDRE